MTAAQSARCRRLLCNVPTRTELANIYPPQVLFPAHKV